METQSYHYATLGGSGGPVSNLGSDRRQELSWDIQLYPEPWFILLGGMPTLPSQVLRG